MQTDLKGVNITESAAQRVKDMLAKRGTPEAMVRIGVTTAGCSGMSYKLEYADVAEEGDRVFEQHGVRVVVDGKSLMVMDGLNMDFVSEQFKSGFRFSNPKEKERCGCGESFKI